ncbi:hypothetical protein BS47DRAFT_1400688 [Hydnum rufescens UP504]|uniref:DEAD/DEAH-box helicase domain-containing protein n=1 Tax=Hydnum rufescens UP504 TaxID=1448309 RepID=A0A9P6AFU3_9AGAM|nr:hypothetical protein BS47DRAFT_1400688 [Hydnum rufescens UP504]
MTNVFIGAPTGIGKTICTEFSLLRLWSKSDAPCAVCIEPYQDVVDQRVSEWRKKFGNLQGREEIVGLTGVTSADLRILEKGARVFVHPVSASGAVCIPVTTRAGVSSTRFIPQFEFFAESVGQHSVRLVLQHSSSTSKALPQCSRLSCSHLLCFRLAFSAFRVLTSRFPKYLASIANFVDEHSS